MTTHTNPFEIIAAFVDGERVDAASLKDALATPDARDYLVEMVALREVVAQEVVPAAGTTRPSSRWLAAAAAAIVLSLAGGYTVGHWRSPAGGGPIVTGSSPTSDAAPAPTRVIQVPAGSSLVTKGGY